MKRCYYQVLCIEKSADENQIRKAYKKLAMKWHPDRNPDNAKEAEEKFKEIGEAYACLSDKDKKLIYDKYGHDGLSAGHERTPGGHFQPGRFSGFSDFNFTSARGMFDNLFQTGFFGDDDDFFSDHFKAFSKKGSSKGTPNSSPFGAFGGFGFDDHDDIFSQGSLFKSFSRSNTGGMPGVSKTKSTSTVIKDGKKVITEKTTTTTADGKTTVEIKEIVSDQDGRNAIQRKYIQQGSGNRSEVKTIKK